ncbi:hypothetical protein B0J13DRAFT_319519 [Dactylonectria estremocensis]|uniref:Uncharacterized protein n=1 Tax=Dactylonectria estremocensis TaxID=1079267 RepID=A0A9P9EYW6_9HYPO|nr:hypothetical protein B0J13DRAFT_319519 [Dactylonectria estremocensis]
MVFPWVCVWGGGGWLEATPVVAMGQRHETDRRSLKQRFFIEPDTARLEHSQWLLQEGLWLIEPVVAPYKAHPPTQCHYTASQSRPIDTTRGQARPPQGSIFCLCLLASFDQALWKTWGTTGIFARSSLIEDTRIRPGPVFSLADEKRLPCSDQLRHNDDAPLPSDSFSCLQCAISQKCIH